MITNKHFAKLVFLILGGAISLGLLVVGGYQLLEFTDSTAFCGQLCHNVMYPEFTAYQNSSHSRVLCVNCHVGPGASYFVKSKISGIPLVFATITGRYDRPIPTPVTSLRPARETCEQCHRPDRFAGDLVVTKTTYKTDAANTMSTSTRVLRVGGGPAEVASGIHWHIGTTVWYLSLDSKRNEIAWVGVQQPDGSLVEYINPKLASQVTQSLIDQDKRQMDCIDCHNRATHIFQSPSDLADTYISLGRIDPSIPFIKKEIVSVLDPPNSSLAIADSRLDDLGSYYATNYPDIYKSKKSNLDQAIAAGKEIARLTTFPDMRVTWETYPSNAGHTQAPGCFRCHGLLVLKSGPQSGAPVSADCTLCHYQFNNPNQP